jgi:hypothetical protein
MLRRCSWNIRNGKVEACFKKLSGEYSLRFISGIDILLSYLNTRSGYTTDMEYLMKITEPANVVSGPHPHHVDVRRIDESPHAMAVVIPLKPGESLNKHITPVDVFFSFWKDPVLVKLPMRNRLLEKARWLKVRQGIPHCLINESSTLFRAPVEKVPKSTEETRLL